MMRPAGFDEASLPNGGFMRGQPAYAATQHPLASLHSAGPTVMISHPRGGAYPAPISDEFDELFQDPNMLLDSALLPVGATGGASRKRPRKGEPGGKGGTDDEVNLRKERNKVHAKRSRMRRKFLLDSLREQLVDLRRENTNLRQVIKQKLGSLAPQIFQECCQDISPIFSEITGGSEVQLNETDQKLMMALQRGQQCFVLCSATMPGNTIIFASEGFLELTGYSLDQVLGRPALFLTGKGTSEKDVEIINRGIAEGRDTTVCIMAYKADGTAFWDQLFFAPLCDSKDNAIYFVAVHCDIETCPLDDELQNVVKKTSFSVMEQAIR